MMNIAIVLVLPFCFFSVSASEEMTVQDNSLFSVITQKGGVAKGLAHNHFIHAPKYEAKLAVDADNLESTQLEITFSVTDLLVDQAAASAKWYPKIEEMGILDEAFSEQSEKNLKKIRKSMFGNDQLNLKKFTEIKAVIQNIKPKQARVGKVAFTHEIHADVTVVGKTVAVVFSANLAREEGLFRLEAVGVLKFSDFGIEPYSALFGAISVLDPFHIYVRLEAK